MSDEDNIAEELKNPMSDEALAESDEVSSISETESQTDQSALEESTEQPINPIAADLVDRDDIELSGSESKEELKEDDIVDEKPDVLRLDLYIEALIFAAEYALNVEEIRKVVNITFDQNFKKQHIQELIDNVRDKYEDNEMAIQLRGIAGGYLFMTKPQYHRIIGDFLKLSSKKKLSKAAMETLSIIAYKQPITKSEIESIRGVNADYAVQKLLEKELVEITGRHDGPGRPLLYGTSTKFLNHFGISGAGDLPKLKEFETPEDTIGVVSEEE